MKEVTLKEFLERISPGTKVMITKIISVDQYRPGTIITPDIEIHCPNCQGQRFFSPIPQVLGNRYIGDYKPFDIFLKYACRNCRKSFKDYAIRGNFQKEKETWIVSKYGEFPPFGTPTPARTISLIGPDRVLFLKGRRCENQELGIGAFVYYRRVIENQKNRIFDEIIRVSSHLSSEKELTEELEIAKKEIQFTKGVEAIKHALPQALLINGQNPLLLLHAALSKGVHELSDDDCLQLASSIRLVLIEFADRLAQAIKDETNLNEAVNRLSRK